MLTLGKEQTMTKLKFTSPTFMTQIEFNITFPKRINDIFYIIQDKSEWKNKTKYIKKGNNPVPNRDKTLSEKELLIPKTRLP